MRSVCVIGAGPSGLVSLRHLVSRVADFEVVAYEQGSQVGGQWVFSEEIDSDQRTVHSSVYSSLVTNLPKNVIAFPDFPFCAALPTYMKHTDVLHYLEEYAHHFNFNTKVTSVVKDGAKWSVTTSDVSNESSAPEARSFDVIFVCNGHYTVPMIPQIEGIGEFKGRVLHSHDFRRAADFKDQAVMCLGAGLSGFDITVELAPYAKQVYLSHWNPPFSSHFPSNVQQTSSLVEIRGPNTAILHDGDSVTIDTLLLCTGYQYTFPFFDSSHHQGDSAVVRVDRNRVTPLYKHLIHAYYPRSLMFIGICERVVPMPLLHYQVLYAIAAVDGSLELPSTDELLADIDEDYRHHLADGLTHQQAHRVELGQWDYNDEIAAAVGCTPLSRVVKPLLYENTRRLLDDPLNYKAQRLDTLDDIPPANK